MKKVFALTLCAATLTLITSCTTFDSKEPLPTQTSSASSAVSPTASVTTTDISTQVQVTSDWKAPTVAQHSPEEIDQILKLSSDFSAAAYANAQLLSGDYTEPNALSSSVDKYIGDDLKNYITSLDPKTENVDSIRDLNSLFNIIQKQDADKKTFALDPQRKIVLSLNNLQMSQDDTAQAIKVSFTANTNVPVENADVKNANASFSHTTTLWITRPADQWLITGYISDWTITPPVENK